MAQYSIEDLKRINICPILVKNKWNYIDPLDLNPTYLYGIKEIFRWYYRRSSHISPDVIAASISNHALRNRLEIEERADLEKAFRKYTESGFYREIAQPYWNKEIVINLNEQDTLAYTAPVVVKKDKSIYIVTYDLGSSSIEHYLNRYETIFLAFWGFYVLDTIPKFINLYYENGEIKEQRFKINQNYIQKSKEKLIQIGRSLQYSKSIPPPEICRHCDRRTECQEMINVEMLLRK